MMIFYLLLSLFKILELHDLTSDITFLKLMALAEKKASLYPLLL